MHGSSYHGVVDQMVNRLAELRAMRTRREAYLSLARAILEGESRAGDLTLAEPELELQTSAQSTRAA
jgi:hypothetical protein